GAAATDARGEVRALTSVGGETRDLVESGARALARAPVGRRFGRLVGRRTDAARIALAAACGRLILTLAAVRVAKRRDRQRDLLLIETGAAVIAAVVVTVHEVAAGDDRDGEEGEDEPAHVSWIQQARGHPQARDKIQDPGGPVSDFRDLDSRGAR